MAAQKAKDPSAREFDRAAAWLKLLADPTRLRLVWALRDGEAPVNELARRLGVSGPAVSQHLAKLRLAHLVSVRREGTRSFYRLEDPHVRALAEQSLFHAGHTTPPRRARHHGEPESRATHR